MKSCQKWLLVQAKRNRTEGVGSLGSELKQSDGVEETSGHPLKCIIIAYHFCTLYLLYK